MLVYPCEFLRCGNKKTQLAKLSQIKFGKLGDAGVVTSCALQTAVLHHNEDLCCLSKTGKNFFTEITFSKALRSFIISRWRKINGVSVF